MKGKHSSQAKIELMPTIEEAVIYAQNLGKDHGGAQILVTGSFRHVGGVLAIIEQQDGLSSN